jgi:hypothetical protein
MNDLPKHGKQLQCRVMVNCRNCWFSFKLKLPRWNSFFFELKIG